MMSETNLIYVRIEIISIDAKVSARLEFVYLQPSLCAKTTWNLYHGTLMLCKYIDNHKHKEHCRYKNNI